MEIWYNMSDGHRITVILAFIGWAVALWQGYVAYKRRKSEIVFKMRLETYNEYFAKLDGINERLRLDMRNVNMSISKVFEKILQEPENSTAAIIEMQRNMEEVQEKANHNITQATSELQKLRFIAPARTLKILDNYKEVSTQQMLLLSEVYASINVQNLQNINEELNGKLVTKGEELTNVRDRLEKQMRKDIGIE